MIKYFRWTSLCLIFNKILNELREVNYIKQLGYKIWEDFEIIFNI